MSSSDSFALGDDALSDAEVSVSSASAAASASAASSSSASSSSSSSESSDSDSSSSAASSTTSSSSSASSSSASSAALSVSVSLTRSSMEGLGGGSAAVGSSRGAERGAESADSSSSSSSSSDMGANPRSGELLAWRFDFFFSVLLFLAGVFAWFIDDVFVLGGMTSSDALEGCDNTAITVVSILFGWAARMYVLQGLWQMLWWYFLRNRMRSPFAMSAMRILPMFVFAHRIFRLVAFAGSLDFLLGLGQLSDSSEQCAVTTFYTTLVCAPPTVLNSLTALTWKYTSGLSPEALGGGVYLFIIRPVFFKWLGLG